jgi:hypothetical protein
MGGNVVRDHNAMNIGSIAIAIAIIILMFYSGLMLDGTRLKVQLYSVKVGRMGWLLLANYVFVPIATIVLISVFNFGFAISATLVILSLLPCAPVVPALAATSGKSGDWAVCLFLILSLLNLTLIPLFAVYIGFSSLEISANWAQGSSLARYIIVVYGPLLLGGFIAMGHPRYRDGVINAFRVVLAPLLVTSFLVFLFYYRKLLLIIDLNEVWAMTLFEAVCITGGLITMLIVPSQGKAVFMACAFRNVAMGVAFAAIVFPDTIIPVYMMQFTVLLIIGSIVVIGSNRFILQRLRQFKI